MFLRLGFNTVNDIMTTLYHNCFIIASIGFGKPVTKSITTKLLNLYELFNGSLAASAGKDLIEIDYEKSIKACSESVTVPIALKRIL